MAIIMYSSTDFDAPDLENVTNESQIHAIIYAILVAGYNGNPGHGWEVTHDSSNYSTGTDGRFVIKHPDFNIYYVLDDSGPGKVIVGMADLSDAAGNLTGYQSGTTNVGGSVQGHYTASNYTSAYEHWNAFYDDQSHTLIFKGASGIYSKLSGPVYDQYTSSFYIGTLATTLDLHPFPFFGAGQIGEIGNIESHCFPRYTFMKYTTIKGIDGLPADGSKVLRFSQSYSSTNEANPANAGPMLALTAMTMVLDGFPVGHLRGILKPNEYGADNGRVAIYDAYTSGLNYGEEGGGVKYPLVIGGETFYPLRKERESMLMISTDPARWADL